LQYHGAEKVFYGREGQGPGAYDIKDNNPSKHRGGISISKGDRGLSIEAREQ